MAKSYMYRKRIYFVVYIFIFRIMVQRFVWGLDFLRVDLKCL